jgi:hypothetical protein
MLAGWDVERMQAAATALPSTIRLLSYDATDPNAHQQLAAAAFAGRWVDLVMPWSPGSSHAGGHRYGLQSCGVAVRQDGTS